MISKCLTIAAAIVLVSGLSFGPAFAQAAAPAADAPAAAAPATPDAAPAAAPSAAAAKIAQQEQATPYGLTHIWETGTMVSKFIIVVLAIMSAGT
jgi:hypothetical protein